MHENDGAGWEGVVPFLKGGDENVFQNINIGGCRKSALDSGDIFHSVYGDPAPHIARGMSTTCFLVYVVKIIPATNEGLKYVVSHM